VAARRARRALRAITCHPSAPCQPLSRLFFSTHQTKKFCQRFCGRQPLNRHLARVVTCAHLLRCLAMAFQTERRTFPALARSMAKTARISSTRLHDTRHTAASHLIVGCRTDARTAASVLGHTNPTATLSIYAHLFADAQRAALSGLGKRLERISAAAANGDLAPDSSSDGHEMATVTPLTAKNARKNERSLVEARRLELLTLTLPA
jgi:Phage integrase family